MLDAGRVVEEGRVVDVFMQPHHEVALIGDGIAHELPPALKARVAERLKMGSGICCGSRSRTRAAISRFFRRRSVATSSISTSCTARSTRFRVRCSIR